MGRHVCFELIHLLEHIAAYGCELSQRWVLCMHFSTACKEGFQK